MSTAEAPAEAVPDRGAPAVQLTGITKRFPGVVANYDINLTVAAGEVHAHLWRERRRQVHPDEDPLRHAAAGRGHDRGQRRARCASATRRTPSAPASAWCTSTSCWPTTSPSARTCSSAPRRCTASAGRPAPRLAELAERTGLHAEPDTLRRAARRRRPAARRDRQGALPRREDHHPGRADRRAGAAGGRRRCSRPSGEMQARRLHLPLHLAQARRGARDRRHRHGDPPRHHRRHRRPEDHHLAASWPR